MSNVILTRTEVRKQLRTISSVDFQRAHTKLALIEAALILGVVITEEQAKGTKQTIYDAIIKGSPLPDQSLRGKSTIDGPVAAAWAKADEIWANADTDSPPRRKDIVAAMEAVGITYYTARTQYQAFFDVTLHGTRRLADVPNDELPKKLQKVEEAAEVEA
jgi:hypothetical protein